MGFVCISVLTLIVGAISYTHISKIVHQLKVSKIANRIMVNAGDAQAGSLRYIIYGDEKYYEQVEEEANNILLLSSEVRQLIHLEENIELTNEIDYFTDSYKADNILFYKLEQEKKEVHLKRVAAAKEVTNQIIKVIEAATEFSRANKHDYQAVERVYMVQEARNAMNRVRITANKYVTNPSKEYEKALTMELDGIYVLLKKAEKLMASDITREAIDNVFTALHNYIKEFTTYKIIVEQQAAIQVDQIATSSNLLLKARSLRTGVYDFVDQTKKTVYFQLTAVVCLAIVFGLLIGAVITRGITRPLARAVIFANHISNGELNERLEIDQKDEVGLLVIALNNMSNKLRNKYSSK